MAVSNNILFMAIDTMHLLRIDLDKAEEVEGKDAVAIWFAGIPGLLTIPSANSHLPPT
jgi:hypothetical protein